MAVTRSTEPLTIDYALEKGLDLLENPNWRRHQVRDLKSGFRRFMAEHYPKLKLWKQLEPSHVHEFVEWLELTRELAPGTVNNYVNVIRKASHYVELYHRKLHSNLFVRKTRRNRKARSDRYLMPDQLAVAISTAMVLNKPAVAAAFAFGGLAGIGILEMMDITRDDIDGDTVRIRREKNEFRARIIPMSKILATYANSFRNCFHWFPARGYFSLTKDARMVLNKCAERTGDVTYKQVTLHEATRVTFANNAKIAGVPSDFLDAYLGHTGKDVLTEHYLKLIPRHEDLPRIREAKLKMLRLNVVKLLDKNLQKVSLF